MGINGLPGEDGRRRVLLACWNMSYSPLGQDCWVLEGWLVSCGIRWWTTVTTDIVSAVDLLWEGWRDNYFRAHRGILSWFAKTCLSSFHLCFYLALFVYVVFLWASVCVCASLSLSLFSLSFLSSSVRMPRLQAPDNVGANTCILQGALGSTEAHSVHIFQIMGWNTDTQRRPYWKHLCRKPFRNTSWSHISPLVLESSSWICPWLPCPGTFALLHSSPPCQFHWKVTWLPGCPRCCPEIFIPAGGALKMFANWSLSQESLLEDKQEVIKQHLQWPMIWVWRQDSPRVVIHCLLTVDKHRTTVGS